MTLVINPALDCRCRYFLSGRRLPSQL